MLFRVLQKFLGKPIKDLRPGDVLHIHGHGFTQVISNKFLENEVIYWGDRTAYSDASYEMVLLDGTTRRYWSLTTFAVMVTT